MTNAVYFSKFLVTEQVFFKSKYTYALVNLKPLVPGHVLVVPLRTSVVSMSDLTKEESNDYFSVLQLIQRFITWQFKADSLNIAIQDGPEAGQSVPHLHIHIIPRFKANNIGDKIYNELDEWSGEDIWANRRAQYQESGKRQARKDLAKPDSQRVERTTESMKQETMNLKSKLDQFINENPDVCQWIE